MDYKKNPDTKFKSVDSLSKKDAKKQIDALREGIEYHNCRYYIQNDPVISDSTYDKLLHRLQELEEAYPEFQSDLSPTKRVGAEPVEELKKKQHTADMLSLNAALDESDVNQYRDFVSRNLNEKYIEYVLEPKFDGLSVEVVYKNGEFQYGATRGDGHTGEDISDNLKTIKTLGMYLHGDGDVPDLLSVRGEVYMTKEGFLRMNRHRIEQGDEPFANPRNSAAGIMRQLDPRNVADKALYIVFYEILKIEGTGFRTHWEELEQMHAWGLRTDPHNKKVSSFDDAQEYHRKLSEQRDDLDYEIDGIVIKINDLQQREKLGTRERSPRWALAWKFPPKQEVTTLEDIVVQVGRTGMLTPVALLQPVEVGGVTVSRATLHNEDEVKRKDVRPGDMVRIERAGDVIPEVVERIAQQGKKRSKPFSMPDTCPACGSDVYREGAYYFCQAGLSCTPQLIGRVIHYASREAMDIGELGDKTVEALVKRGMISDVADLYDLKKDDFLKLEGFADKSAQKLYDAIQGSKKVKLDVFLYALGIRHVGRHIARVLAMQYKTVDDLQNASVADLKRINEIGPEIAQSIREFFDKQENQHVIENLFDRGVTPQPLDIEPSKQPLTGKTIVVTGELEQYTRDEIKDTIERMGGRATSSVSGNTDFLIVGNNPGSKLDDAKKHNVKQLSEKEFEKMIT